MEDRNRVICRDRRTDVATMAGATITAVDKTVTRAREGRSEARSGGGRRPATGTGTASRAAWARRARPRAPPPRARACPARRAAPSVAARCARAAPTAARCARAPPSPRAATPTAPHTPECTSPSRGAGNSQRASFIFVMQGRSYCFVIN